MDFTINLATRTYVNTRKVKLVVAVIIVLLLLTLVGIIRELAYNHGEIKRLKSEITGFDEKISGNSKGVPAKEYEMLLAKIRIANTVINKKTVNWLHFLDQLEGATPEGVALLTVEPDSQKYTLRLTGAAKNFSVLRRYFETLEASSYFSNVFLENQAEIKVGENQKGASFTITCQVKYK